MSSEARVIALLQPASRRPAHDSPERADQARRPEPRLRDVIGDVLREERQSQERTLADVAERAAISLPYLSEVERGRKEVSSALLTAICEALEVPLAEVLERSARRLRAGSQGQGTIRMLAA